jgi:hypothetical protein
MMGEWYCVRVMLTYNKNNIIIGKYLVISNLANCE